MQYRLHVYGRIYRKVAYLDTQMPKETSLAQLAENEGCSRMFRVASVPGAAKGWQGLQQQCSSFAQREHGRTCSRMRDPGCLRGQTGKDAFAQSKWKSRNISFRPKGRRREKGEGSTSILSTVHFATSPTKLWLSEQSQWRKHCWGPPNYPIPPPHCPLTTLCHPQAAEGLPKLLAAFNPTGLDIRYLTMVALLYQVCAHPLDFMPILFSAFNLMLFPEFLPPQSEGLPPLSHNIPNKLNSSAHISQNKRRKKEPFKWSLHPSTLNLSFLTLSDQSCHAIVLIKEHQVFA